MLLPFLSIFIIVTLYIAIRRNAAMRSEQQLWENFREREQEANWARRQDISNLAYIRLPLDTLPLGQFRDEALQVYETALRDLSTQPICNLNGISNTDLKLRYGAANLNTLSQCDTNYSTLVSLLANYGEKLFQLSHPQEAKVVLEYALSLGTDVAKTYDLLASIYEYEGQPEKISALFESAQKLNSIRRNAILRRLEAHIQVPHQAPDDVATDPQADLPMQTDAGGEETS